MADETTEPIEPEEAPPVSTAKPAPSRPPSDEAIHDAAFGERTEADIMARELTVVLGGVEYVIPVLPIKKSREWRRKHAKFFSEVALLSAVSSKKPKEFAEAFRKQLLCRAEHEIDLFFDYAKGAIDRDATEEVATDWEMRRAFDKVLSVVRDPFPMYL